MTFQETMEWQRENAPYIKRLAKQGDKLAKRLIEAYIAAYGNQKDEYLRGEWMKVCDDFCRRDLTIVTRVIQENRYGKKYPGEKPRRKRKLNS